MILPMTAILIATTLASALLLRVASVVLPSGLGFVALAAIADVSQWLEAVSDSFWTYAILGASAIVTEELSPIFGGIAAHEGELRILRVILWKWELIRRRFPRVRATGTLALRAVRRNQLTASLLVRFAFGLRVVLPMACGAAQVPVYIFLPLSLVGSALWTTVFTAIGYAAGEAAVRTLGHLDRVGEIVGAVLVTVAVLGFVRWQRIRRERKSSRRRANP